MAGQRAGVAGSLAGAGVDGPLRLIELSGGIEWRGYLDDNYRLLGPPGGGGGLEIDRRRRQDTRYFAGAAASLTVTHALSLTLRYDLVVNQSNVAGDASDGPGGQCGPGGACHRFDGDNRGDDKHVISLGTALTW